MKISSGNIGIDIFTIGLFVGILIGAEITNFKVKAFEKQCENYRSVKIPTNSAVRLYINPTPVTNEAIKMEMWYRWVYKGSPITEEPTNSLEPVTNIIIGTNYTGTISVGTNYYKLLILPDPK